MIIYLFILLLYNLDIMITFPQRQIKKNYRSITGHFPSVKNNKSINFESKLEKTLFLTLEFDDHVETYQEQPQIQIDFDGKIKTYSADCYVHYKSDSNLQDKLIEVKYSSELIKKREYFEKKFTAIKKATSELGLIFSLFTEENFSQTYLDNLDFLYRYKTHGCTNEYDEEIIALIDNQTLPATFIVSKLTDNPNKAISVANSIWGLVADNKLTTEMHEQKITMNSLVKVRA